MAMKSQNIEVEVNFIIYRKKSDTVYTAVCLDFDIVETGDHLEALKESIEEAAKLHIETVLENNLSQNLLHRSAPQKYWKQLYEAMEAYENKLKDKRSKGNSLNLSVSDIWNRNSQELALA